MCTNVQGPSVLDSSGFLLLARWLDAAMVGSMATNLKPSR